MSLLQKQKNIEAQLKDLTLSKIEDGLYISGIEALQDEQLQLEGITHILSVCTFQPVRLEKIKLIADDRTTIEVSVQVYQRTRYRRG